MNWTAEKLQVLERLWVDEKRTQVEIAEIMGATRTMIIRTLTRTGIRGLRDNGQAGVPMPWAGERLEKLRRLWVVERKTQAEIAQEFGISQKTASRALTRTGVRFERSAKNPRARRKPKENPARERVMSAAKPVKPLSGGVLHALDGCGYDTPLPIKQATPETCPACTARRNRGDLRLCVDHRETINA